MSEQLQRLLRRLDAAWTALGDSYAGVPEALLVQPGVVNGWSVKDILAHVTTWEQEALRHLPQVIAGGTPPRYAAQGGIDAFNARATADGRRRSLAEVLRRRDETHARLVDFVRSQPEGTFEARTRARRRLRLDTYGHYPEHTAAIRAWRERLPARRRRLRSRGAQSAKPSPASIRRRTPPRPADPRIGCRNDATDVDGLQHHAGFPARRLQRNQTSPTARLPMTVWERRRRDRAGPSPTPATAPATDAPGDLWATSG